MYNKIFTLFLVLCIFQQILCQTNCNTIPSPKSYSECSPYNNTAASTICCWVRGVYGGNNGTACLAVDDLFKNKMIIYIKIIN